MLFKPSSCNAKNTTAALVAFLRQLFDVIETKEWLYLVMELVQAHG